ncbi:hypothetical protein [Hymenobacter chitinivorans]|uniref:Uncharacterized protein n=1 Tax=Hymenobacter chitinivorans DSM 11115 TaxID=1121954 RepID=A0A2M9BAQ5_9BACT|nr:hypothetical protein [Hymenobacter chitinivorans]PJJ55022.1 hypothetical protein CLV45_3371 [Hymenobacter chitinivorans DSM 11115]
MNSFWNSATAAVTRSCLHSVALTVGCVVGWLALYQLGLALGIGSNLGEVLALLSFLATHLLIWKYGVFRQWRQLSPHLPQAAQWLFVLSLAWNVALVGFQLLSLLLMVLGLALALDTSPPTPGYN